jgi:hypothetical protein
MEDNNKSYEVAIDIGATRTKIAYTDDITEDTSFFFIMSKDICQDPDELPTQIMGLLKEKGVYHIKGLYFSFSGVIDSKNNLITLSYHLNNKSKQSGKDFIDYNIHSHFTGLLDKGYEDNISAMNDAACSALGSFVQLGKDVNTLPLVCLNFGTTMCAGVVYKKALIEVYNCEDWMGVKMDDGSLIGDYFNNKVKNRKAELSDSEITAVLLEIFDKIEEIYKTWFEDELRTIYLIGGSLVESKIYHLIPKEHRQLKIHHINSDKEYQDLLLSGCFEYGRNKPEYEVKAIWKNKII